MGEYGWIIALVTAIGAAIVAIRKQKIEGRVTLNKEERDYYGQLIKDMRNQHKVSIHELEQRAKSSNAQLTVEIESLRQKCERIDIAERKCREDFITQASELMHLREEMEEMRTQLEQFLNKDNKDGTADH